jgi:hypothetical protein
MSNGEPFDEDVIEVGEGNAGEPEEADERTRGQGDEQPLPPSAFDEFQEQLRETRRQGGPDLDAETRTRGEADEDEEVPDVEPTETEDEGGVAETESGA